IVLERTPAEINNSERQPRTKAETLLDSSILLKSVMQGFSIFLTSFGAYYIILERGGENRETARTVGLVILILSNLFLVIVNSSSYSFAYESMKKLIKDKVMWLVCGISLSTILILLYTPVHKALKLEPLSFQLLMKSFVFAMLAVFWYEIIKLLKKIRK
ncbi:MAG: cation transporting ATPase C-terminal domain-containing protein, partial [Lachnospiraceae bacterium]